MEREFSRILELVKLEVQVALERIGLKLQRDAVLQMRNDKKYATRNLIDSITYEIIRQGGNQFNLKFGTPIDYAKYVQEGRVPGRFPPYDPNTKTFPDIERWVKKKRLDWGIPLKQQVFLIARKMAQKGVDPYPFISQTVKANEAFIAKELEAALNRAEVRL